MTEEEKKALEEKELAEKLEAEKKAEEEKKQAEKNSFQARINSLNEKKEKEKLEAIEKAREEEREKIQRELEEKNLEEEKTSTELLEVYKGRITERDEKIKSLEEEIKTLKDNQAQSSKSRLDSLLSTFDEVKKEEFLQSFSSLDIEAQIKSAEFFAKNNSVKSPEGKPPVNPPEGNDAKKTRYDFLKSKMLTGLSTKENLEFQNLHSEINK